MGNLTELKELVLESDNTHCFIERERILKQLALKYETYSGKDKYARVFSDLLSSVSTPVYDCDFFAGRVVEAPLDADMTGANGLLYGLGHMSFDYEKLLRIGLKGILSEIKSNAHEKGDNDSLSFAKNAEIVIIAIKEYCDRYASMAEEKGFFEMAKALKTVPFEPAYDFYSALQGIWMIHMIASCYVGGRDYAFGRFDHYMLAFYEKAIRDGKSQEELTELLAGFMIKTNEICGRTAHDYKQKPILSHSSNQYINIGGESPNEFSRIVLNAAMKNCMAQPEITVLLKPDANEMFTKHVFEALAVLTDKMNIYHYDSTVKAFCERGVPKEIAKDYTYSACCTADLNYHTFRREYFVPVPQIFVETLHSKVYGNIGEILSDFQEKLLTDMQRYADETQKGLDEETRRKVFVLDALFLSDSAAECRYPGDGNGKYYLLNLFCPGVATIGDSLMVLDKLVFREKRYSYSVFMEILKNSFEGHEELRLEILGYTRFGNDTEVDEYAVMAGNTFLDAVDRLKLKNNFFTAPGFYSLERDNTWKNIGATPDGRKVGDPFSENQSPTYGADKSGITALLKSLAKLPFDRTVTGGLNLTFAQDMKPRILSALVLTYFQLGGFHVGISVVRKEELLDAMVHPDKYKTLTVRLYGFSEYFVSLAKWQQIALINRTAYENEAYFED